jgi:hypothetical protein
MMIRSRPNLRFHQKPFATKFVKRLQRSCYLSENGTAEYGKEYKRSAACSHKIALRSLSSDSFPLPAAE